MTIGGVQLWVVDWAGARRLRGPGLFVLAQALAGGGWRLMHVEADASDGPGLPDRPWAWGRHCDAVLFTPGGRDVQTLAAMKARVLGATERAAA